MVNRSRRGRYDDFGYLSCAGFSSRTESLFKKERQADDEGSVVSRKTEIIDWWTKQAWTFGEAS
jgi:hypothetical protein